jgi:ATP-dependent RNA helicase HelY
VSTRARFEAARGFPLDDFQRRALDALDEGQSVLVAAPTGSGKTLVAEYAVELALDAGQKVFYTTPLKALSNQKYGDLAREHGATRVGLLTGDNSVNGEAPVVVMTTEVLRNMIYAASPTLDGLRYVVLDEVHYLQDRYRGAVWEEVIVHLPPEIDLVCLSATVSNAEEVAAWIETVRGSTSAVIEERRPVALEHRYLVGERGRDGLHLLPTFVHEHGEARPNPQIERLERRSGRGPRHSARARSRLRPPARVETVELLDDESMLPAIVFVFSRAGCEHAVDACRAAGLRLTKPGEAERIRAIAEARTVALADADLDVLDYDRWLAGLEAGIAAHHAGVVPPMKEAVEEAFAAGLVKVVFATETLALGINMPARSVVIEKLTKFTGERHEMLTPGEYTQLTGRAGRRGIDNVGYAVVCWSPWVAFEQVAGLASRRTDALRSSFRPTYNMAVNLVGRYGADDAHRLLNLSFAQFHADRDVVALEQRLERARAQLERQRSHAQSEHGDVEEYGQLTTALDDARRTRGRAERFSRALASLRPGDVVWSGRHGGKVAVLGHDDRGAAARVLALSPTGRLLRLGADDFDEPPAAGEHVALPEPYAPRSRAFQREVLGALRALGVSEKPETAATRERDRVDELERAVAEHPVAHDPQRGTRLRAGSDARRLEREITRLERRVRGRTESLARQFDRVRALLEARGYLDGWALTGAGEMLARLYAETDLLLAESLRAGHLDGLTIPETAAVVSCFTYERRGPEGTAPTAPLRWPTKLVATRARAVEAIWRDLAVSEEDAGCPQTRPPDPGFTPYVHEWAAGDDLGDVLDDDVTGGDFVRHVKQCIDLLRQVADVAPEPTTRAAARGAADACQRGVVAVSAVAL